MSLKFLAVGQSFGGVRGDKSPYELKKENRLPIFSGAQRPGRAEPSAKPMVQTDFLQEEPIQPEPVNPFAPAVLPPSAAAPAGTSATTAKTAPAPVPQKKGWFSWLKLKWFRTTAAKTDLVQSELSLDKVRVKRNDLADSDLQLVIKKRKKTKPVFATTQASDRMPRQGWSELSARLFEIGQK